MKISANPNFSDNQDSLYWNPQNFPNFCCTKVGQLF